MRVLLSVVFCVLLASCAGSNEFKSNASLTVAANNQLAKEVVTKLSSAYPPATTHICVNSDNTDFYLALNKALQLKGYAMQECASTTGILSTITESENAKPIQVTYAVNDLGNNLVGLRIKAESKVFSRLYFISIGKVYPAGQWTYQE